jgi:D-alanyl-D-alanine dipeptidase
MKDGMRRVTMAAHTTKENIVLIADTRVLQIPIQENHEPMVDIQHEKTIVIGPSPEIPNNTNYTKMRKTVYEKLLQAQKLLPRGLKFCLYEAYRSIALQEMLFQERYQRVKASHPHYSHEQVFTETIQLVSPVINLDGSRNVPPHATGAAVDVYLLDENNQAVDMGIHPADWMADLDGKLSYTISEHISKQAQHHRDIMSEVLSVVGFVNYPTEYWHWSYGDRYWAFQTKEPFAIYGAELL